MNAIDQNQTLILNKSLSLPQKGIICAHPGRAKRIAEEFFNQTLLHTDYRGFQVYTGIYEAKEVFVANTGIGAPAAAFLVEELASFGAKRILRLGSNDSSFNSFKLKIVEETTLPIGLCRDYEVLDEQIKISSHLLEKITLLANFYNIPIEISKNRHIDGYYFINFNQKKLPHTFGSQDMESGALYLISKIRQLEFLSILISYPKHETFGEYQDQGKSLKFESLAIRFSLDLLLNH